MKIINIGKYLRFKQWTLDWATDEGAFREDVNVCVPEKKPAFIFSTHSLTFHVKKLEEVFCNVIRASL